MVHGAENLPRIKLVTEIGNTCASHKVVIKSKVIKSSSQLLEDIRLEDIRLSCAERECGRGAFHRRVKDDREDIWTKWKGSCRHE